MNKTVATDASVDRFLEGLENPVRRRDGLALCAMMRQVSGAKPRMWGPSIVGFGSVHYRYESGRERADLASLGKHRTGVSCLYINKLTDVDLSLLESLIYAAWNRAG